jgi:membrane protease YdiL (CAAX protease family)
VSEAPLPAGIAGPCKPWGFAASFAWGIAAIAAWLGVQLAIGDIATEWFLDQAGLTEAEDLATHGPFVALVTIGGAVVPLLVVALAVRNARCGLAEYLGLHVPERRYVLAGLLALAILIPLVDLVSWLAGYAVTPQLVVEIYRSARDSGVLVLLTVALVFAAPAVEEIVFRGFLLPGFAASWIGPGGAILLTSAIWTLLHAQYQPFYLIQIMVLGIVFGWLRLHSGSTLLTTGLHGILNLTALVQAAFVEEWLS